MRRSSAVSGRRMLNVNLSDLDLRQIDSLNRDGFLLINLADSFQLGSLRMRLESLVADAVGSEQAVAQRAFWGPTSDDEPVQTLRLTGIDQLVVDCGLGDLLAWCVHLGEQILDVGAPSIRSVHAFVKRGVVGRPTPWHQDPAYAPSQRYRNATFWIPLCDTDPQSSGFRVIAGSHRDETLLEHVPVGGSGTALEVPEELLRRSDQRELTCEAGQAVVHLSYLVHGSTGNSSHQDRHAIAVVVGPEPVATPAGGLRVR